MSSSRFLAPDLPRFKQRFIQQLLTMLEQPSLGAFILVLANSLQDEELYEVLRIPVRQRLAILRQSPPDNPPEDDLQVFQALCDIELDELTPWRYIERTPWRLMLNPIRKYRPARASTANIDSLYQPFAADGFHFNKPFLQPEILWEGEWNRLPLRILYNKFPLAPWHLLIVPEPAQCHPQYPDQELFRQLFAVVQATDHLPGFGLAYNSLGAFASVNHLHFQGFIQPQPLPIESSEWTHHQGGQRYPLEVSVYQQAETAWQHIEELHQANQPYHLLLRPGNCYLIPQQGQLQRGDDKPISETLAWQELCGIFTLADEADIIDTSDIHSRLSRISTLSR